MKSFEEIYNQIQEEKKKKLEEQRLQEQQRFDEVERQRLWILKDRQMHERFGTTVNTASAASSSSAGGAGGSGNKPKPTMYKPFIIELTVEDAMIEGEVTIPHLELDPYNNPYVYDYTVDWGDGTPTTQVTMWNDSNCTHTYTNAGTYQLTILGKCETFYTDCYSNMSDDIVRVISWGYSGLKRLNFLSCQELVSVPGDTQQAFSLLTELSMTFFNCIKLSSIPADLFRYCNNVTSYYGTFVMCTGLTSIPSGLFDYSPNVTNFFGVFYQCYSLTSIPSGLFNNCPNVTDFTYAFEFCTSLTGLAPELWLQYPSAVGTDCFHNDNGLTNFSLIPVEWGGELLPTFMTFNVDTTHNSSVYIGSFSDNVWFEWSDGYTEFNSYTNRDSLTGTTYTIIVSGDTSVIESSNSLEISGAIVDFSDIRYMTAMQSLNINNSSLSTITNNMLKSLWNVTYVEMYANEYLTSTSTTLFKDLPLLEDFEMGYNNIGTLPSDTFQYNPQLKYVDFYDTSSMSYLPSGLFANNPLLKDIEFRNDESLLLLPLDLFSYSPNIEYIDINSLDSLTTLQSNLFNGFNVSEINIENNSALTTIESYTFNNLHRYYYEEYDEYDGEIYFYENYNINSIESYAFNNCEQNEIDMYYVYGMSTINSNTFNNCTLYNGLYLDYFTGVTSISDDAFYGSIMNDLYIYEFNSLTHISDNAFRNTSINRLQIQYTNLSDITNINFGDLTGLTSLSINSSNNLNIGDVIKNLPSLTTLDLSNNQLNDSIIPIFDGLPLLNTINMSYNNLTNVDFLLKFPNLVSINVGFNNFTDLPSWISGFTQLMYLDWSALNGELKDVIKDMPNLESISLYGDTYNLRYITSLSSATFSNLAVFKSTYSTSIGIAYNNLSNTEMDAFLINIDTSLFRNTYINAYGNNGRTAASNTAVANLQARGCTINIL